MSNWRTMRPRLAPSAPRTANSLARAAARAKSKLERFTPAISRIAPRCHALGVVERLGQCDTWVETAEEFDDISPIARIVKVERDEKIDLRSRRKHGAEIETRRQNSHHSYRRSIQLDGLAHDGGVGCELTPPIGITEQSDRLGNGATLIGGEEPPQGGLHAENLEEVADDFDAGGWLVAQDRPQSDGGGAIHTNSCALGKGSGLRSSVLTALKTAMLAPMARARMRTATNVKPRSRLSVRRVYLRSCRKISNVMGVQPGGFEACIRNSPSPGMTND